MSIYDVMKFQTIRATQAIIYVVAVRSAHHPKGEWFAVIDTFEGDLFKEDSFQYSNEFNKMIGQATKLGEKEARGFFPAYKDDKYYP